MAGLWTDHKWLGGYHCRPRTGKNHPVVPAPWERGIGQSLPQGQIGGIHIGSAVNCVLVLVGTRSVDAECANSPSSGRRTIEPAGHARDQLHVVEDHASV